MFDLKCKRQGCKFNQNCNCTAHNVKVDNTTKCETYEDSKNPQMQQDKIPQPPTRKNICVSCDAKCLFNQDHTCKANGITVITNDFAPECCTFLPK
ncbi:MAG: DUF1540 domain-containing protein [Clostridia bacterium]|nr:DUF1540 domain-containing protein [Clostridia bacterium]